ncbi:MAG: L-alanine-DL-glutamate epimerase [Clostridia bacterium]|nr:L-alanine-DL-glutamate epimerase [Clostridia bacterium]
MRIMKADIEFREEPIRAAFAFKGKYNAKPMWNIAVKLESDSGAVAYGVANQGILWSDAAVANSHTNSGGNMLMYLISEYACKRCIGVEFETPDELLREMLGDVYTYAKAVTGLPKLRETFALGGLVAFDTAAWLLYAKEKGITNFDGLIPERARPALSARHEKIAAIPLITYSASMDDILREVDGGCFFLKIKIGSDPEHDGDYDKMLAWDKQRLTDIHNALRERPCAWSENGHIPYYLDANGRYDSKDRLLRLLDHADHIGALERIAIMEEPFPEDAGIDVSDLPVRLAADESAHSDRDVEKRISMGYRAIALKPIAKTMSMSFDMLSVCAREGVPAFCADLTVPPVQVDLNKNFAARIPAIPGLKVGLLESNGHQYYTNWADMMRQLPIPDGAWVEPHDGLYTLDERFYRESGGIFLPSERYTEMF